MMWGETRPKKARPKYGKALMIWNGISLRVNAWWRPCLRDDFILQQDNARPHTARSTKEYLRKANIKTSEWPACLPDLNPIVNVWFYINDRLK
ncbi:hypothetical protein B4U80_08064 [Leptotrombidium deliense]|uniref:Tc1-like transposase DDE domain-containing protein n=1 Tax=Leptotrombidium deliense TaxID=299467 RepID=A0A443RY91_9ACAR|nr:hypothetical protein B4U80_08064 [Leptotrombidium deliense]